MEQPKFSPSEKSAFSLCRVVLVEALIPQNTGNVARTCVGTNSELHLVGPLGFEMSESRVKRAGLDYWEHLRWFYHNSVEEWWTKVEDKSRVFFIETGTPKSLYDIQFQENDWLVFGKETSGLTKEIMALNDAGACYLPMPGPTRSLNLSNAVAISVFEVLRQTRA